MCIRTEHIFAFIKPCESRFEYLFIESYIHSVGFFFVPPTVEEATKRKEEWRKTGV